MVKKILIGVFVALWLVWGLNQCAVNQGCIEERGVEDCGVDSGW
jgi:hypothetical protein